MAFLGRKPGILSPLTSQLGRNATTLSPLTYVSKRNIHYETPEVKAHIDEMRARAPEMDELVRRHETFEKEFDKLDQLTYKFGAQNAYLPGEHTITLLRDSKTPVGDSTHETRHSYDTRVTGTLDRSDSASRIQGEFNAFASQRRAADQAKEPYRQVMYFTDPQIRALYEPAYGKPNPKFEFKDGESIT